MPNLDDLTPELYQELRRLARQVMRGERPDHTLQPTALVNEAYLKLARAHGLSLESRGAVLALAARAMRQVLTDHARGRRRAKRGGDPLRVTLAEGLAASGPAAFDLVALDEAMSRLEELSAQQASLIELRFFAGLTVEEAAAALGISATTAKRDTAMAKAWLRRELGPPA